MEGFKIAMLGMVEANGILIPGVPCSTAMTKKPWRTAAIP